MTEKADLTLQLLKADEDQGVTLDNNPFYQELTEVIESDPKMGDQNEFSIFPYSIVENEADTYAMLVLVINRLEKPIRSVVFDLTLGNQDGEYIFDAISVDLVEEYMGILEIDGVIPIFLEVEARDVDLFYTLDPNNLLLEMDNFKTAFVE